MLAAPKARELSSKNWNFNPGAISTASGTDPGWYLHRPKIFRFGEPFRAGFLHEELSGQERLVVENIFTGDTIND